MPTIYPTPQPGLEEAIEGQEMYIKYLRLHDLDTEKALGALEAMKTLQRMSTPWYTRLASAIRERVFN